jgi:type II secretory pathway component PulK
MYTEILERPAIESLDRIESAYKYIGLWGNHQVNINTAPRHVLEAAFTFGGDEAAIADEIIRLRKIKPFDSIEELSKVLYQYNDTIDKSKPFIITRSNVFTVRITAYSGTSTASVIAAVLKEEKSVQNIVVILK